MAERPRCQSGPRPIAVFQRIVWGSHYQVGHVPPGSGPEWALPAGFPQSARLQDMAAVAEQFKPSPLVKSLKAWWRTAETGSRSAYAMFLGHRAPQIASSEELTRLERRIPCWRRPATSPVRRTVRRSGASSMPSMAWARRVRRPCAPVAPGISEALITTAAGLFAAIPAVIAYNLSCNQIREFGARMDDFTLELAEHGGARRTAPRPGGSTTRSHELIPSNGRRRPGPPGAFGHTTSPPWSTWCWCC